MRVEIPLGSGFYESASLPLAAQKCVNWFPHIPTEAALSQASLFQIQGVSQLATAGSEAIDKCRGAHVMGGTPFFVLGSALYSLDRSFTSGGVEQFSLTNLGTITGSGKVSMADNGTQLVVQVPGSTGYVYDGSLTTISDGDFTANGNPQYVVFIDGYFVWSTDSKKFIASAINDATSIDALDFGSAEADPDDIVAPFVYQNQLIMLGSETYEIFQNIGGTAFPFQRIPGAVVDVGLTAPLSLRKTTAGFYFLGAGENDEAAMWRVQGNGMPQKISSEPIEAAIQTYDQEDLAACHAWSYSEGGHHFVGFTFPQRTFVYDEVTGKWHERVSVVSGVERAYRCSSLVRAYGRTICGDEYDGRVGALSESVFTEYGNYILREASTQVLANRGDSFFLPAIEITLESGLGNSEDPAPQIELQMSRDGRTWSNWRSRAMGKIGEYMRRCVWRRNGRISRFCYIAFRCTDDVQARILRVDADIG